MHGTNTRYRKHLADGDEPCDRCRRAAARLEQQYQLDILAGRDRLVDKAPTIRRLQALLAMGWTGALLSEHLGRDATYVKTLMNRASQPKVRRVVAEEIDTLYERLCMTPGPSESAQIRARKKGWLTPLAYDDIETGTVPVLPGEAGWDPQRFDEDLVDYVMQYHDFNVKLTRRERIAVTARWIASGRSEASLCRLTGWRPGRYSGPSVHQEAS